MSEIRLFREFKFFWKKSALIKEPNTSIKNNRISLSNDKDKVGLDNANCCLGMLPLSSRE